MPYITIPVGFYNDWSLDYNAEGCLDAYSCQTEDICTVTNKATGLVATGKCESRAA